MTPRRGQGTPPAKEKQNQIYPARREQGTIRGGKPLVITYVPRTYASPEAERAAIAAVLRFVIGRHASKKAGAGGTGYDAKENKHVRAERILPG